MKFQNLSRETPTIKKSSIEIDNLTKSPYNMNLKPNVLKKCKEIITLTKFNKFHID